MFLTVVIPAITRLSTRHASVNRNLRLSRFVKRNFRTMSTQLKIGTHNGEFHCDEALACFMLKLHPKYKNAEIVRTRDDGILDTCDIVVDVGAIYDPSKHRYDHHMNHFTETYQTIMKTTDASCNVKLSSAGLIYCHFGQEILRNLIPKDVSDLDVQKIFKNVYLSFIKEIDCIDNGMQICDGEPLYYIRTDISSRVKRLNPPWNDSNRDTDKLFLKAIELVGEEFMHFLNEGINTWLPAEKIIEESLNKRFEVDPSGEICELSQFVPWTQQLASLEADLNIIPPMKYVIFADREKTYRVRAVPVSPHSMVLRKALPEAWRGLRDDELVRVSGVKGALFVHSTGFIGGTATRDDAIEMARKSLAL